jgi:hypothetical protein
MKVPLEGYRSEARYPSGFEVKRYHNEGSGEAKRMPNKPTRLPKLFNTKRADYQIPNYINHGLKYII